MRSVFRSGATLAAILIFVVAPVLSADDFDPNQAPEARGQPPIGVSAHATIQPPIGIRARIQPPGGWTELLLLVWQLAKIGTPIG